MSSFGPHATTRRGIVAVALVVLGALVASSCAGSTTASASRESPPRPTFDTELPDSGSRDPDAAGPDAGGPDAEDGFEMPDIPELELPDVPDFGETPQAVADCLDAFSAYSELTLLGMFGDDIGELDRLAAEVRQQLPTDLYDELDTVVDIIEEAAAAGFIDGTELLLSDEYMAANDPIMDWLARQCTGATAGQTD